MPRLRLRWRRQLPFVIVPLALLTSGALVWQASYSAFTATTTNGTNSWTTGTVNITNDQSGAAVFNGLTGLKPDSTLSALSPGNTGGAYTATTTTSGGSACIKVTYSGSVNANIRMYATLGGADVATLGGWTLFTVDAVAGNAGDAANPSCSAFPTGSSYVYGASGTTTSFLGSFPTTYGAASGTQWGNVANGGVKWYRLSWLLPSTVSQTATATRNVTATFTWEADSV